MAAPMYDAVSIVNTNACMNATNSSIAIINNDRGIAIATPTPVPGRLVPDLPNMNINPTKLPCCDVCKQTQHECKRLDK